MDLSDLDPQPARGPLSGLLVADFSRVLAGPYATMLLGDLGATVIKVEGPGGDDTRTWQPPVRDTEDGPVSTYYLSINRNKRSVVLDLKDPGDRELAATLARRADILVENFKHGGLTRFGLDYDTVRATNPGVIYCSITGFGTHEGAALPGYDLLVQAVSGLMSLTGSADGSPYRAGVAVFDVFTGLHAGMAILAALHHRDRTGEGQHVETSLLAAAMSSLVNQASAVVAGGVVPHRMGNAHPSLFPYEPLPTADGELIVIAGNDNQYRRLCTAIGRPELGTDERFATMADRTARRAELRPMLLDALAQRTAAQWFDILTEAGVPCGPINTVADGIALAQRLGLDPIVDGIDGFGSVPTVRNPVDYSATPPSYRLPPPALGADTDTVRAWLEGP
ncbi:MAG TPA: CoA transferase [Pseudonocardiaceae bacterium]|nr:CoA transferase [Pseudonocardiaceae bacterium]